ncbi:hypothetical protein [Bacillus sp. REN3]|uniref:hypothetical protein n=1 Tax=Bacillus sp. REN3 TaxID=2802440 RepID=UPI001AEED7DC|nr:hypothetical protein [Bacillus sp. REN3]
MIDKKLIEQIVHEVIQALEEKDSPVSTPINLLLIGDKGGLVQKMLEKAGQQWSITAGETAEIELYDQVLFIGANQDFIVKGALGMADSKETEQLARCLLAEKKVSIIPEPDLGDYLFKENCQTSYVKKLREYMEKLQEYGAIVETLDSFVHQKNTPKPAAATIPARKKKLLTQRDVQDSRVGDIIVCPDTIITPSAHDAAKELGKSIIVAGQRS